MNTFSTEKIQLLNAIPFILRPCNFALYSVPTLQVDMQVLYVHVMNSNLMSWRNGIWMLLWVLHFNWIKSSHNRAAACFLWLKKMVVISYFVSFFHPACCAVRETQLIYSLHLIVSVLIKIVWINYCRDFNLVTVVSLEKSLHLSQSQELHWWNLLLISLVFCHLMILHPFPTGAKRRTWNSATCESIFTSFIYTPRSIHFSA